MKPLGDVMCTSCRKSKATRKVRTGSGIVKPICQACFEKRGARTLVKQRAGS